MLFNKDSLKNKSDSFKAGYMFAMFSFVGTLAAIAAILWYQVVVSL